MNQEREQALVDLLRDGNIVAYQALLKYHLPALSRYVTRMVGNAADAEEIIQDVFLSLWQKINQFNPQKAKLTTWLHKIAYNRCIDHFRKYHPPMIAINNMQNSDLESSDLEGNSMQGETETQLALLSTDTPQQKLLNEEESITLSRAIQRLPEGQRSALVLCHYQGLSNRQAAEVLSISVHALESLLSRSRKKLQNHLQSFFFER